MEPLGDFSGRYEFRPIECIETDRGRQSYLASGGPSLPRLLLRRYDPVQGYAYSADLATTLAPLIDLDDPSLLTLLDLGSTGDSLYAAYRYVEARPLAHWVHGEHRVAGESLLRMARQLGDVLQRLHGLGIPQVGLDPAAVVVCPDVEDPHALRFRLRDVGIVPAATEGGMRDDLAALGRTLFYVLARRPPDPSLTTPGAVRDALLERRPELDDRIAWLVARTAMAGDDGYDDPADLLTALRGLDGDEMLGRLYEQARRAQAADNVGEVRRLWAEARAHFGAEARFRDLVRWADEREFEQRQRTADDELARAARMLEASEFDNSLHRFDELDPLPSSSGEGLSQRLQALTAQSAEVSAQLAESIDGLTEFARVRAAPATSRTPARPSSPAAAEPARPMAFLESESTADRFPLEAAEIRLGRLKAGSRMRQGESPLLDLQRLPWGKTVSRDHASLTYLRGRWMIRPNPATQNPTLCNGKALAPGTHHPLEDGDRLQLGGVTLLFRVGAANQA